MAEVKFNVLEAADATSFNIYKDQTADITPTGAVTLTIGIPDGTSTEISLDAEDIAAINSDDGLDITGTFVDGVYTFTLTDADEGFDESSITEGFAAIITDAVSKELLSYRVYLTEAQKSWMNEKWRLLNNLRLASSVAASDKFTENLQVLQRMQ